MAHRHFKFIPALAAGFMAVALSACGGGSSGDSGGVTDTPIAPTITTQPAAQTVTAGQQATFSVTATGTAPLIYQWQKNSTDISGATSSTYTTPATAIGDNGAEYSVVVGNSFYKVASSKARLTVTAAAVAPAITTQPAPTQTVTEGQPATFSVTATGTAPLTYQWKKDGTVISGATSSTYITPATSSADNAAVFTVVVTNGTGSATSSNATLTVTAPVPPAITVQPSAQTITAGAMATFSVTATGTGTLSYQWKKNGINITGGMGATTNTYTTPAMGYAGNSAVYSVVVSNSAGTTTSSSATLTVSKSSTAQSYGQVANASDGLYDKTECVQDNNTGLIWEGKTASGSRLGTSTYTNYDDLNSTQKPSGATYVNPTQTDIDASTNSIGYRDSVRTSNLCGYNDWRLPTREELQGILASSGSPRIDTTWFPNTQTDFYWSSMPAPNAGYSDYAFVVNFGDGNVNGGLRSSGTKHVRLVR